MDWNCSGDTDGIIPVTTTRYSMAKLGAPVKTPWYPWDFQGEVRDRINLRLVFFFPLNLALTRYVYVQVGGYVVGYENVTFVSIRGAGHFVPSYQPQRAIAFFTSFIEGKLPPSQN